MRSKRASATAQFQWLQALFTVFPLLYSAQSSGRTTTPQRSGWSLLPLTNRSLFSQSLRAQIVCGILIAFATVGLTSCHSDIYLAYKFPEFTFANRPVPPSLLANRVMISVTSNGVSSGSLQIVDALRDLRSNIQNTKTSFSISGYASGFPNLILNFPAEVTGFVYSNAQGDVQIINYSKESTTGSAGSFPAKSTGLAVPPTFAHVYSAEETIGQLGVIDNATGKSYGLILPNVFQVVVNQGDTVVLAMVRNSNTIYRLIKLNDNQFTTSTAAIQYLNTTIPSNQPQTADCEPLNLPIYCLVPVNTGSNTTAFDRPSGAYFSLDGTAVYLFNCGAECGDTSATAASSVTYLNPGALQVNTYTDFSAPAQQNPNAFLRQVLVPGGVTAAVSNGTTLYVSGQQRGNDGLFAGNLSTISLTSNTVTGTYSISDGTHTKMLFADNNTLWIGSQFCATGERASRAAQQIAANLPTDQSANYNCLTRFDMGALTVSIVPSVTQSATSPVTVPFPNTNQNQYYYGDLTGLCWVQGLNKMYTAYGGQVHVFSTVDGSEINNKNVIVQGTALDVAYMDAITDADN
jgi:hypothetical protein